MEENNGFLAAIEVLGDKIIALQESLRFAGYKEENLEAALAAEREGNARLAAENERLREKLDAVKEYMKMKEEESCL